MKRIHSEPKYIQLAKELVEGIYSGRFLAGGLLPTEKELCRQHNVSLITVRGAMKELEIRGLVSRRPGIGTRVESNATQERFRHVASSTEGLLQSGARLDFQVLAMSDVTVDSILAIEIRCPEGERFVVVEALRILETGLPVCVSLHYVPRLFAANISREFRTKIRSFTSYVAQANGEEVFETVNAFDATHLTAKRAKLLKVTAHKAALDHRQWCYNRHGTLLVYSRNYYPEGRSSHEFLTRRASEV